MTRRSAIKPLVWLLLMASAASTSFDRGVAAYHQGQLEEAAKAFEEAVRDDPLDARAWLNLGDVRLFSLQARPAADAFARAIHIATRVEPLVPSSASSLSSSSSTTGHSRRDLLDAARSKLHRARSWTCDWSSWVGDEDALAAAVRRMTTQSTTTTTVGRTQISAADLLMLQPNDMVQLTASLPNNQRHRGERRRVTTNKAAPCDWMKPLPPKQRTEVTGRQRHRITEGLCDPASISLAARPPRPSKLMMGVISADFGVHPVSSLVSGWLTRMHVQRGPSLDVRVYATREADSWWGERLESALGAERFVRLPKSHHNATDVIARAELDVLVDLNGHTLGSGLPLMAQGLAPAQVTFLGAAQTTAASWVHWLWTDARATPPDVTVSAFSESLVYWPHSFFINDYHALQAHVRRLPRPLALRQTLVTQAKACERGIVLATFASCQKLDPHLWASWIGLLRQLPCALLWVLRHSGSEDGEAHLKLEAAARGVAPSRIIFTDKTAWIDHLRTKAAADLVLDSRWKNGHTTVADALWAGVPVVTITGPLMNQRVASSLIAAASACHNQSEPMCSNGRSLIMDTHSLREQVTVARRLASSMSVLLATVRSAMTRPSAPLFDPAIHDSTTERAMQVMVELTHALRWVQPPAPMHAILGAQ